MQQRAIKVHVPVIILRKREEESQAFTEYLLCARLSEIRTRLPEVKCKFTKL